jgi:ubiquinone/menaquinone biosynthesis C-methylase UbiE
MSNAKGIAAREGFLWGEEVSGSYFDTAERDMDYHWESHVAPFLSKYAINYAHVLDLAAGHGRNSERLSRFSLNLTIVDINPDNIAFCKARFAGRPGFRYVRNDGASLCAIRSNSITFFYTFDSMVHFDSDIVQSYILEAYRVLKPGGIAYFHYSNYTGAPGGNFLGNPHWRNFMSTALFNHTAIRAGFTIIESVTAPWGGIPDLDGISLLRKPHGNKPRRRPGWLKRVRSLFANPPSIRTG